MRHLEFRIDAKSNFDNPISRAEIDILQSPSFRIHKFFKIVNTAIIGYVFTPAVIRKCLFKMLIKRIGYGFIFLKPFLQPWCADSLFVIPIKNFIDKFDKTLSITFFRKGVASKCVKDIEAKHLLEKRNGIRFDFIHTPNCVQYS